MKNCTKHFLERWTERIVGIKTEKELKEYITQNKQLIEEHANKTFEYSQFIYKGQINDNITRNYYLKDNLIFVLNTTDDAFITIYKVDLGFPEKMNLSVAKELIIEIEKLKQQQEEAELTILEELEAKEFKVSNINENIKILEEQLKNLKESKKIEENNIQYIKNKNQNVSLELKKYVMMLVNSLDYKKDLLNMK